MVDTVRTEAELQAIFADGQGPASITPQDMRDFTVSSRYLANQGWEFVLDGTYTSGAPRAIAAGVRTQATIDGVLETSRHPTGAQFWNTTTNKLIPNGLNNFGIVRFHIQAQSTAASVNRFEIELDAGGGAGVIFQETGVFAKGAGNPQNFNFTVLLFAGADFLANGGTFYITPLADATFWEFALTSVQVYGAAP